MRLKQNVIESAPLLTKTEKGSMMKKGIHPEYVPCKVTCVTSGKEIEVLSTKSELRIDISSFCHPFYTGSDKITDITGRVEKFRQKYNMK